MNNFYIYKKIISAKSISELDIENKEKLGFDYEKDEEIVVEENLTNFYVEGEPWNIDDAIACLEEFKKQGANYVAIDTHIDHYGYDLVGIELRKAMESEVKEYNKRKKENDKSFLQQQKKILTKQLEDINQQLNE